MSLGGGNKSPRLPKQEPIEEVAQVKQDETAAAQQEKRKRVQSGGRQSTIISGIREALKSRLGQ